MNMLKNIFTFKKIKIYILYLIGTYCTFNLAYYLAGVSYLYPYFDSDLTPLSIMGIICYPLLAFLCSYILFDNGIKAWSFAGITMLLGVILCFAYMAPFKTTFTNDISDIAYYGLMKRMELSPNKNETLHSNKEIDEIYSSYENKDVSKLVEFENKINNVRVISDEHFAQLIVNVRVLNNNKVTLFYNKILDDKRISVNEYNEIIKLIVSEETNKDK